MKICLHQTLIATALIVAAPLAFAQSAPPTTTMPQTASSTAMPTNNSMQHNNMQQRGNMQQNSGMHDNDNMQNNASSSKMMGWHGMPSTVTSVDHTTGIVKLKSIGKKLKVHFPPPTITNLKSGDKITLELGYKMSDSSGMPDSM